MTINIFYSRADNLPIDQKSWLNSSIDEFVKLPVRNLKQWVANTKNMFKLNKTNNNYGTRKITDYFEKGKKTTENELTDLELKH